MGDFSFVAKTQLTEKDLEIVIDQFNKELAFQLMTGRKIRIVAYVLENDNVFSVSGLNFTEDGETVEGIEKCETAVRALVETFSKTEKQLKQLRKRLEREKKGVLRQIFEQIAGR